MGPQKLNRREMLRRVAAGMRRFWSGPGAALIGAGVVVAGGFWRWERPQARTRRRESGRRAERVFRDFFAAVSYPDSAPRLSVAIGESRGIEQLVRAAIGGLDSGLGMGRFVHRGDVVLIKPNVGFDRPPPLGATAHPEVVRAVIRLCREAGARRVLVTDNPIESPAVCFARCGIGQVAQEEGAEVVWPDAGQFEVLSVRQEPPGAQEVLWRWPILSRPLERADRLIGIAPVKDHNLSGASMVLKNWYGLLGGRRNQFHQKIHEVISDLALLVSPTLVIADGTRVMLRNGPTGGRLSDVAPGGVVGRPVVVAAVDPVACDAWCWEKLLGRGPEPVEYLKLAEAKIRARVAAGRQRPGLCDWREYERRGQIRIVEW
jgi:uncharacterized protein (DUF362 family)